MKAGISQRVVIFCLVIAVIPFLALTASAWPDDSSGVRILTSKEFSGTVQGADVRSVMELGWLQAGSGSDPCLVVRVSGAVTDLPADYISGRVSFIAGIFKLGVPDTMAIDEDSSRMMCWNGSGWSDLRNVVLNPEEEEALASAVGRGFLTSSSPDFDSLQITSSYAELVSPDVFIVEPTSSLLSGSGVNQLQVHDFYWLEAADFNGEPLINRENLALSFVDTMPIEIKIPFELTSAGECPYYLGYLEAICLERADGNSSIVYNYRVWEGRLRMNDTVDNGHSNDIEEPQAPEQDIQQHENSPDQASDSFNQDDSAESDRYMTSGDISYNAARERFEQRVAQALGNRNSGAAETYTPRPPVREATRSVSSNGMVLIPAGTYYTTSGSLSGYDDVSLQETYLGAFLIDEYPVTNMQYWEFLSESGYESEGNWRYYYEPGTDNYPVRGVSYNDAEAYALWMGKRLPTEFEWEAAARGTDQRVYPWGSEWISSYAATSEYVPVDSHPGNVSPFGAYEMAGNVWEWTASTYFPNTTGAIDNSTFMVLKGGSVNCSPELCMISSRGADPAIVANASYGFRCAMDVPDDYEVQTIIDSEPEERTRSENSEKPEDNDDRNTAIF